jgi:hypothetical protein
MLELLSFSKPLAGKNRHGRPVTSTILKRASFRITGNEPVPNFERILNLFEAKGWYLYKANH